MRVMLTVSDWTTHWLPMVAQCWALQAAGHEVRVVCAADQEQAVTRAGLTPVPVLEGGDQAVKVRTYNHARALEGRWPFPEPPPHPVTGAPMASPADFDATAWMEENWERLLGMARRSADAAVSFARWWRPHLILHDLVSIEGPLVGRALGIPAALHLWGPTGPDDRVPGAPPGVGFVPLDVYGLFERYGAGTMDADVHDLVIDPSPPSLAPPLRRAHRLPVRHVPYNGPGAMPSWLRERPDRPRVGVVWGTSVTRMFGPSSFAVPRVVEALAGLDVDVVLTVTGEDLDSLGPLPPRVRAVAHLPLRLLLADCDLVVHHGGAGCVMTALAAGVVQLALPNALDQELIGDRLAQAGGARALHNAVATPAAIRGAATDLLQNPAARAVAARLRTEMEQAPTPAALVGLLEEHAHGHRG
ncbi:nucleotide disphospho-sugar-binding domain-containing protein [Streptomyces sp. CRN 30]|uniref:nucleotide disphospho-sugar-binding domain-containing protein n=1 Tax=Streptomyces sp. CRN 30 TaxID=3075613 RepID=UPI002A83C5F7|nr:nucleotide disphospho-sugar-binding domain-containing protein [Streptomyces sp. CRN 30]